MNQNNYSVILFIVPQVCSIDNGTVYVTRSFDQKHYRSLITNYEWNSHARSNDDNASS